MTMPFGWSLRPLALSVMLALAMGASPASAVTPDEILGDSGLEGRARALSQTLRCVVCQNQSIDDSNAPLARDLRLLVRERLSAGDSDEAVLGFIVARYGHFVLLQPPLQANTLVLWLGPLVLLLTAFATVGLYLRGRRNAPALDEEPLTLNAAQKRRLTAILSEGQTP